MLWVDAQEKVGEDLKQEGAALAIPQWDVRRAVSASTCSKCVTLQGTDPVSHPSEIHSRFVLMLFPRYDHCKRNAFEVDFVWI